MITTDNIRRQLIFISGSSVFCGIVALITILITPSEPGARDFWLYSYSRLAFIALILLVQIGSVFLLVNLLQDGQLSRWFTKLIHYYLKTSSMIFRSGGLLLIGCFFSAELFLLSFIGLPSVLRVLFLWSFTFCLVSWIALRVTYKQHYFERGSIFKRISREWQSLQTVQKKTFRILILISIFYFLLLIPFNIGIGEDTGRGLFSGIDEQTEYPAVIRMLTPGENFSSSIHHALVNETLVYGYPFLSISAASLLGPRLIFGANFGDRVGLNLFLLRMLINVLPMIASLFLLTWVITRFMSLRYSILLFLILLSIPGVINYNIRFFHPDGVLIFFIILTFFFLQRDELRLGRNFSLAAVSVGMAAIIKLWGLFFVLALVVHLCMALANRRKKVSGIIHAGLRFQIILVMTFFLSSPGLMLPHIAKFTFSTWVADQDVRITENAATQNMGNDGTGLSAWMPHIQANFMRPYFLILCMLALVLATFIGLNQHIARIILAWCVVAGGYLVYFVAIKSFWYMMPVLIPLYGSPFFLPAVASKFEIIFNNKFRQKLPIAILVDLLLLLFCGSQFICNIVVSINQFQLPLR